jgi:hypothetical protein
MSKSPSLSTVLEHAFFRCLKLRKTRDIHSTTVSPDILPRSKQILFNYLRTLGVGYANNRYCRNRNIEIMQGVKVTPFREVIAAEMSWSRRKLHALKMMADLSPDNITCKITGSRQIGHLTPRRRKFQFIRRGKGAVSVI